MGAFATAFLSGLGQAGSDVQEAKTNRIEQKRREDEFALRMKQFQEELKRAGISEQLATAPQVVHTYRSTDGKVHNLVRNPITGGITDQVVPGAQEMTPEDEKVAAIERQMGRKLTEQEKQKLFNVNPASGDLLQKWDEAMQIGKMAFPNDPKKAMELARSLMPGGASVNKIIFPGMQKPPGSGAPPDWIASMANMWQTQGIKPPAKYQAEVEAYMNEQGINPQTKLSNAERQVGEGIRQVKPMVERLIDFIEKNDLKDENSFVFGSHSALMQHLRFWGYQKGIKPEDATAEMVKDAAAIGVQGAKPLMTMGRGKYMYEQILQHLPRPTDTPQLLYDKVTWLRDNVIADAEQALPEGWEKTLTGGREETTTPEKKVTSPQTPAGAPAVGTIEDGHRFMGGDPSKPENWVPVGKKKGK